MKLSDFFQHINAEMVGGKIKALYKGVHHVVAELVDGTPALTQAGHDIKAEVEDQITRVVPDLRASADAMISADIPNPALAGAATAVANTILGDAADLIRPTSDGSDAAAAQPIPVTAAGQDVTKAPSRKAQKVQ